MRLRTLALTALILLAMPAVVAVAAKKTPTPKPIGGLTFRNSYTVTVVNIDAFVTDKKGNPVTGLTKDDFQIFQDGVEKKITNFAPYTHDVFRSVFAKPTPGLPAPAATPTPTPVNRPAIKPMYMAIYIDNDNLRPIDRNRVMRKLRRFVRENLQPPMRMMVLFNDHGLKVLQPFTTDPEEIYQALRGVRLFTGGRSQRDSAHRDVVEMLRKYQDQDRAAAGSNYNENAPGSVYHILKAYADEERNRLSFSVGALREAVSMLAGLPGRKSILYISDGLQMTPAMDLFYDYAAVYHSTSILSLMSQYERTDLFKGLVNNAAAQGVTFYTIGAQGLQVSGAGTAESRYAQDALASTVATQSYNDSLHYMAEGTGGRAIVNTNDFAAGLQKISKDLYTYYSLGYTITSTGRDIVHRIKVKLRNKPGYTVRYRRHFVEKSLESRVQDQVMSSLVTPFNHNPMQIAVSHRQPAPATNEWWTVPIHVSFPLRKVALLPDGDDYVGRVILYVAARDSKGKQSDIQHQEHEVRIPGADYEDAKRQRFGIDLSLLMAPGIYRVSVGVLDEITQQASYFTSRMAVNPAGK